MQRYKSIVHIGFHKTGTTSIQSFLSIMRERLLANGYAFYRGLHIDYNHVELHVASMREGRLSPFRFKIGHVCTQVYKDRILTAINSFADRNVSNCLIFSAEGLSYLRYEDEIDWVSSVIPKPLLIVAYLRNKDDYIKSYKYEMTKHNMPGVDDKDSVAYTGLDTWLLDYGARLTPFQDEFGKESVLTINYDDEVRKHGTVIPSFVKILDLTGSFSIAEQNIYLNRSKV